MKRINDKSNDKDEPRQASNERNADGRRPPNSFLGDSDRDCSGSSNLSILQSTQKIRKHRFHTQNYRGQRPIELRKNDSSDFGIETESPIASTCIPSSESSDGSQGQTHFIKRKRYPRVSFSQTEAASELTDDSADRSQHDRSEDQIANYWHKLRCSAQVTRLSESRSTTRTYVNPNFLSRTTSELGISTASSRATISNAPSQNSILPLNPAHRSVNFNELANHILPRNQGRSSAGSDVDYNFDIDIIDKENHTRPRSCMCTKCGKTIKPENNLLQNDNGRINQKICSNKNSSCKSPRTSERQERHQKPYDVTSRNAYADKKSPYSRINSEPTAAKVHKHRTCKCCSCSKTVSDPPITKIEVPPITTGQTPVKKSTKDVKDRQQLTKPQQLQPLDKNIPQERICQCKKCSNSRCNQRSYRDRNLAGQSSPQETEFEQTIDNDPKTESHHSITSIPVLSNKSSGYSEGKEQKSGRSLFASVVTILSGAKLNPSREVSFKDSSKTVALLASEDNIISRSSSSDTKQQIAKRKSCSCKLRKRASGSDNASRKKCHCKLKRMETDKGIKDEPRKEKSPQSSIYIVPKINDSKQNLHRYSETCPCSICTGGRKYETNETDLNPSVHEYPREICKCKYCAKKHSKEKNVTIDTAQADEVSEVVISERLENNDVHQESNSCSCKACARKKEPEARGSEEAFIQDMPKRLIPERSDYKDDFHRDNISCNCTSCTNKKIEAEGSEVEEKEERSEINSFENLDSHPQSESCNCKACIRGRQCHKKDDEHKQAEESKVGIPEKREFAEAVHRESKSCDCNLCADKKQREENENKQRLEFLLPPREDVTKRKCKCKTCAEKRRQELKRPCSAPELQYEIPNTEEPPKRTDSKVTFKKDELGPPPEHQHQQPCSCSICVDRTKCEQPETRVCTKETPTSHKVETKPSNTSQILQHPRIPNAIINLPKRDKPEVCPCKQCDLVLQPPPRRAESEQIVRLKTSTATQLLQHPRIPSRAEAGHEDKVMHTYDCTCQICLDPSISKHPLEKEKKKPWKLPWSSKQPVELKPRPHPLEVKPWKVSDVFQHPRIPLVVDLNTAHKSTPKPKPETCSCEEDKQKPKVVRTKSTKMVGLFQKPRVPLAVDSRNRCRNIFGVHEKDCHCVTCEDRAKCKIETECPKVEPVQVKSRSLIQIFQRPRIPNSVKDEDRKPSKTVLDKPELIPGEKYPVDHLPCEINSESCPCVKTFPKKHQEVSHSVKSHSIADILLHHPRIPQNINDTSQIETDNICTRKRSAIQLFQRPRLPNAIGAKVPSFPQRKKASSQPEICRCEEHIVDKQPAKIKRSSFSQLFQHPRISSLLERRSFKSTETIHIRTRSITTIFRHPRLPTYEPTCSKYYHEEHEESCKCDITSEPCRCNAKPHEDPNTLKHQPVCDWPTKPREIQRKPWYVSDLLQHPRIPNATDDKPRSETGSPEVCPCSKKRSERKKAGSCFPSRVCLSKSDGCKVETIPTDLANLCQRPRYAKSLPSVLEHSTDKCSQRKPGSCPCMATCVETECHDNPIQESVQIKHWNPSALMQRPRIPVRIDVVRKPSDEKDRKDCTCPCIFERERNKWTKVCDELLKIFETCRPARIPNPVDAKEKEPCQESHGVTTKTAHIAKLFQHPRIVPSIEHAEGCDCSSCKDRSKCRPIEQQKIPIKTKPFQIQQMIQHPRIPNAIDSKVIRELTRKDHCPCVESCPKGERSTKPDAVLTKPFNIAALFQHPKIRPITFHPSTYSCTICQDVSTCKPPAKIVSLKIKTRPWKLSNVMQRPRISNAVETVERRKPAKPEECPCQKSEEKHPVSLGFLQRPQILQPINEGRKSAGVEIIDEVLTKPTNPANVFQHPRIPYHEKHTDECDCTTCTNKPCSHQKLEQPHLVNVKPINLSKLFQRPRIPNAIDYKPLKEPIADEPETCPCQTEKSPNVFSPDFCQRPRIPQHENLTQNSSEIHVKPKSIASYFQHPRIPFQEAPIRPPACQCSVTSQPNSKQCRKDAIKLRPSYITSLLQRPRIPTSISECSLKTPHKSESCPCPKKKTRTIYPTSTKSVNPINLCQHPRIPQQVKPRIEKIPSCPCQVPEKIDKIKPEPVQLKPSKITSIFQHPNIRFQSGHSKPEQKCELVQKCECTICADTDKPCETVFTTCASTRVETKPSNVTRVFQHPRILNVVDQEPKHVPEKCPCVAERKPAGGEKFEPVKVKQSNILNIYQKPRIPKHISMEEVCPCDCSGKIIEKPARETERIISKIVRTKPINVFSMFQHPRIPAQANIRPVLIDAEKCPCSQSAGKISQICQHPKIPKPIDPKTEPIEDPSCPCQSKNVPAIHPVKTKPFQHEQLFQRPRLFFQPKMHEHVECPCSSPSKMPRTKPKTVKTKPRYCSRIQQRPRILSLIDTRPLKEKFTKQTAAETCLCAPKEVPRKCGGKESIRTKPVNTVNVFQHPRIPKSTNEIEQKDTECACSLEPKVIPSFVQTKPKHWINLCQHPRIPQGPEKPLSTTTCECNISGNRTPCRSGEDDLPVGRVKTKTPSFVSTFQHPRIPFLAEVISKREKKCTCSENTYPKNVQTNHPKATAVLQRPKIAKHIERPKKIRSCPCEVCSQTVQKEKSKPSSLSRMFQHPRIPNAIERSCSYDDHIDECTCSICHDRIPCQSEKRDYEWQACRLRRKRATVKTKHWSMSSLFQHPRIAFVDTKPTKLRKQNACGCQGLEKRKPGGSESRFSNTVKTKPSSIINMCQKPRIPTQTDQFREKRCPCEYCTKTPGKHNRKPRQMEEVNTKSSGLTSVMQHPRILFQAPLVPEHSEQCTCSHAKEPSFIRTKPVAVSSMFQHPRIPNASDNWERKRKVCKCSVCENRQICDTIYGSLEDRTEKCLQNNLNAGDPETDMLRYPLHPSNEMKDCKCTICHNRARCFQMSHCESEVPIKSDKQVQTQDNTGLCSCERCKSEQSCPKKRLNAGSFTSMPSPEKIEQIDCSWNDSPHLIAKKKCSCKICKNPSLCRTYQENGKGNNCTTANQETDNTKPDSVPAEGVTDDIKICKCTICKSKAQCKETTEKVTKQWIKHPVDLKPKESIKPCACELCEKSKICSNRRHTAGGHEVNVIADKTPGSNNNVSETPVVINTTKEEETVRCEGAKASCTYKKNPSLCRTYQENGIENNCTTANQGTANPKLDSVPAEGVTDDIKNCKCTICKSKAQCKETTEKVTKQWIKHPVDLKPKESIKPCACELCEKSKICSNRRHTAGGHEVNVIVDKTPGSNDTVPETPVVIKTTKEEETVRYEGAKASCTCKNCKAGGTCPLKTNENHATTTTPIFSIRAPKEKPESDICSQPTPVPGCKCNRCKNKSSCINSEQQIENGPERKQENNEDKTINQPNSRIPNQKTYSNDPKHHTKSCTCDNCTDKSQCENKKESKPNKSKAEEKQCNPKELKQSCPCDPCKMKELCLYRRQYAGKSKIETKSQNIASHSKESLSNNKLQNGNIRTEKLVHLHKGETFPKPSRQVDSQATCGGSQENEQIHNVAEKTNSEKYQECKCTICHSRSQCPNPKLETKETIKNDKGKLVCSKAKKSKVDGECATGNDQDIPNVHDSKPSCSCNSCKRGDQCRSASPHSDLGIKQPAVESPKEHLAASNTSTEADDRIKEPNIAENIRPNTTSANSKLCTCTKCKNKGKCRNPRKNAGFQLNAIIEEDKPVVTDSSSVQPTQEATVDVNAPKPNCQSSTCASGIACKATTTNANKIVLLAPNNNSDDKKSTKLTDSCKTGANVIDCQKSCKSNQCSKTEQGPIHAIDCPVTTTANISEVATLDTSTRKECARKTCKDKGLCRTVAAKSPTADKSNTQTLCKKGTQSAPRQDGGRDTEYPISTCESEKCTKGSKCKKVRINTDHTIPDAIPSKNETNARTPAGSESYSSDSKAVINRASDRCAGNPCTNENHGENQESCERTEGPDKKHCTCVQCQNKIRCSNKKKKKWRLFG